MENQAQSPKPVAVDPSDSDLATTSPQVKSPDTYRLGAWFLLLTLFVSFLIMVGGTVRLTESGLSIPEWPIINGSLLPPMSDGAWQTVYNTYYERIHGIDVQALDAAQAGTLMTLSRFKVIFAIEYFHRFLAALVGILFLALFVQAIRSPDLGKRFRVRLWKMMVLLIAQAVLGGVVVKLDLPANWVAVHLGLAFLFFTMTLWTGLQWTDRRQMPSLQPEVRKQLLRLGWIALLLVFTQVVTGGMVAGSKAGHFLNTWPKMGESWLPSWVLFTGNYQVAVQFIHRWWAFVAAAAVFMVALKTLGKPISWRARLAVRGAFAIVVFQVLLGIGTLVMRVPIYMALTHLLTGLLLFGTLVVLTYELGRHEAATA